MVCRVAGNAPAKRRDGAVWRGLVFGGRGRAMTVGLGFGCLIDSDVPIMGLVDANEAELGPLCPRVTIRQHQQSMIDAEAALWQPWHGGLLFTPPGAGQFAIQADRIDLMLTPDDDADFAAGLLIATALPAMMWMRGGFMLHAATVTFPGIQGAIAFIGDSGVGKSTVVNRLLSEGAILIGDDTLVLRRVGQQVLAWGLAGGQFLSDGDERQFVELDTLQRANLAQLIDGVPLLAIVRLEVGTGPFQPSRIPSLAAISAILDQQHRPTVPVLLGMRRQIMEFAAFVANQTPVYAWDRDCLTVDLLFAILSQRIPGEQ